jgi:hydrogenase maturation factor
MAVRGELVSVDYGENGVRENINNSLVNAPVGSYVLVQGGFVIRELTKEEAQESLEAWRIIRDLQEPLKEDAQT